MTHYEAISEAFEALFGKVNIMKKEFREIVLGTDDGRHNFFVAP